MGNRYIEVAVDSLVDNSVTDFDLYLNLHNQAVLYSTDGYHWLKDELERLLQNGHRELITDHSNLAKLQVYRRVNSIKKVNRNLPPLERLKQIEDIGVAFTKCLHRGEVTESCIHRGKEIASELSDCIQEQRQCIAALDKLVSHDEYVFHHSVRVAMYSTAIAIELGLSDSKSLRQIALGGVLHDIGKSKVPDRIINKSGPLSDEEWTVMRSHPELGFGVFKDTDLDEVPKGIILHHHERLDGQGYPHGLDKNSLLPEIQIAALADVFDALTSVRSYQKSRSKYQALELIKSKMVGHHIDPEAFKALISCLAIPQSLNL